MQALVSVIIPIYNVEKYLYRCVRSILAQTYDNLEIILVDDGSPDRCGELCDKYAEEDSRIVVLHKENGGLSDARNYGTVRATGKYIAFIDSDDYIAPTYVEYLMSLITKYDADTACCCMINTECDTAAFGPMKSLPAEQVLNGIETCKELSGRLYPILVTACGKLYANHIVKQHLFPVGRKHEDEAITCKFYYESKTVAIGNQCLYAYYQNPGSIMHTQGSKFNEDAAWALQHRAEFFENKNEVMLANCFWDTLFHYYVRDSILHDGRCDQLLKDFSKGRSLTAKTKAQVSMYNLSPWIYKQCYTARAYIRKLRKRRTKK